MNNNAGFEAKLRRYVLRRYEGSRTSEQSTQLIQTCQEYICQNKCPQELFDIGILDKILQKLAEQQDPKHICEDLNISNETLCFAFALIACKM